MDKQMDRPVNRQSESTGQEAAEPRGGRASRQEDEDPGSEMRLRVTSGPWAVGEEAGVPIVVNES